MRLSRPRALLNDAEPTVSQRSFRVMLCLEGWSIVDETDARRKRGASAMVVPMSCTLSFRTKLRLGTEARFVELVLLRSSASEIWHVSIHRTIGENVYLDTEVIQQKNPEDHLDMEGPDGASGCFF
mmetsp:Transcript_21453/g.31214  ORF Transcript_21453/g.31214 Transcript_21453/m.31214 type:complete len:126 (+) Transcript_21453:911-1288(+)